MCLPPFVLAMGEIVGLSVAESQMGHTYGNYYTFRIWRYLVLWRVNEGAVKRPLLDAGRYFPQSEFNENKPFLLPTSIMHPHKLLFQTRRMSTHATQYPFPKHAHPTPHQIFHLPVGATQKEIKSRCAHLFSLHVLHHSFHPPVQSSPDLKVLASSPRCSSFC